MHLWGEMRKCGKLNGIVLVLGRGEELTGPCQCLGNVFKVDVHCEIYPARANKRVHNCMMLKDLDNMIERNGMCCLGPNKPSPAI